MKKLKAMDEQITQYHEQLEQCVARKQESMRTQEKNQFGLSVDTTIEIRLL